MKLRAHFSILILFSFLAISASWAWEVALPGWKYEFPRDHGHHSGFKTEWWYFTGNLESADGREFGYQLTFFRQGIRPGGEEDIIPLSRFVTTDLKFAHFAIADISSNQFLFADKFSRGAYGEAGFGDGKTLVWIKSWSCELIAAQSFRLRAQTRKMEIDLTLESSKPPVAHGANGVSQKSQGEGRASHYYSLTRLKTTGSLRIGDDTSTVTGLSWFDHEWATNQLAKHQKGWDWFSLQFEDGTELMLFQIRTDSGGRDEFSSGTFIAADGKAVSINFRDFELKPIESWRSGKSAGNYPIRWTIAIPKLDLNLEVRAAIPDQELNLEPISYWEGSIRALGSRSGKPVQGRGYLEMTGYGSEIVGMQQE